MQKVSQLGWQLIENYLQITLQYFMGQNASEHIDSRTTLIQNWLPHCQEPNVLVNKATNQQVQRHFIKILLKDLPREIALFASRMSNHQPNICRLLYFHPSVPNPHIPPQQSDFREMYLYTDKTLPLKTWNKEKLIQVLQGLRKIVAIHGPIKISEGMICQNQTGQVKIWMSQNPVNNHPDSKYMSEQQTVANIGAILTNKNKQLASQLFGCHTLKDVYDKLNKNGKGTTAFNGYSHRASESGQFQKKKIDFIEKPPHLSVYRNVFGDKGDIATKTPKNMEYLKHPMIRKSEDDYKPTSNISHVNKMQQKYSPNVQKSNIQQNSNKFQLSKNKSLYEHIPQFCNSKADESSPPKHPSNYKSMANLKFDPGKRPSSKARVTNNQYQGQKSGLYFQRFQTTQNFGNKNHFSSQTGLNNPSWQKYEHNNSFGAKMNNENPKAGKSFCPPNNSNKPNENQKKRGYEVTIINNNVSNYINNVVHNHVSPKLEKQISDNYTSQATKIEQTQESNPLHCNNNGQNVTNNSPTNLYFRNRQKNNFIPNFIQQKKRGNIPKSPKKTQGTSFVRADTMKSNQTACTDVKEQQYEGAIENKKQKYQLSFHQDQRNFQRKTQKVYTFNRPNVPNHSPYKYSNMTYKNPAHPRTPTLYNFQDQSFTSFQRNFSRPQLAGAMRTKTTEFVPKAREIRQRNEGNLENKSFTQNDREKNKQFLSGFKPESRNKTFQMSQIKEPKPQYQMNMKQKMEKSLTPQKKQLKKQIRQQFNFLLGESPVKEPEKAEQIPPFEAKGRRTEDSKDGKVEQKIIKKKIQFAELKKQAQQLLI